MRVLVVDDDPEYRKLVVRALTTRGHVVDELPSAFGLVNTVAGGLGAQKTRPDVVLLDYRLPGLSGAGALELLARDPRTQDVPVVILSNEDAETLAAAATLHPNCRWLQKGRLAAVVELVEAT